MNIVVPGAILEILENQAYFQKRDRKDSQMKFRRAGLLTTAALAAIGLVRAADPASGPAGKAAESTAEVQQLKELLVKQQEQIEALRKALVAQQKTLDAMESKTAPAAAPAQRATSPDRLVASGTPMLVPPSAGSGTPAPKLDTPLPAPQGAANANPLQLQLGNVAITPVGFMDATFVWRNENAASSLGSNFGSVPFSNAVPGGKLSETRFTPQNSRIGFRIDGNWKGWHFIGYNEFDFLSSATPGSSGVTNGAFVPRLRLYWANLRRDKFEFQAGQSWSMLTPNRKGISALPGDLFYSQVIDVNYVIGLPWTRQPGVRFLYHPSNKVTMGLSLENPNQYGGGSGGGPQITPPAALAGMLGSQIDNTSGNVLSTPNVAPDIIAKIAFDPSSKVHFEFAGLESTFRTVNPTTLATFTKAGGGGAFNANFELFKGFRLVTNNFYSDGGGRYLFGNAPDVILRADGSISPVHAAGFVEGFEATVNPKLMLYGYWGNIYIGRNVTIDTNGKPVGYGFTGSANSNNRTVNEVTFGINHTVWKDAKYGALNLMYQYEYLNRSPWYMATAPTTAHDHTIYMNIRYTLPGAPPPAEK
jgi:hypothetical protein